MSAVGLRLLVGCFALLVLVMTPGSMSLGQNISNSDVVNRLKRLEQELRDLHVHLFAAGGATQQLEATKESSKIIGSTESTVIPANQSTSAAQTLVKLQTLESLVRSLQGASEELNNRLDKLISDLDTRLASLEANKLRQESAVNSAVREGEGQNLPVQGGSSQIQKSQQAGVLGYISGNDLNDKTRSGDNNLQANQNSRESNTDNAKRMKFGSFVRKSSLLPKGDPSTRYRHAFRYLSQREFEKAELALSEFLAAHPEDPLAGNAMYWLGESYYTRGRFEEAAEVFVSGYEKYPRSTKTPDNLLKLGFSLVRLKRPEDACIAFLQLLSEFPKISATTKRRATSESKRIGCTN
ncbi:MAG: tol-pal system protein YbgF [Rhodospirillaceae bacterium]|nr:tol-pal system protein YbgF [Rhodospirillaceae bacterium]|tara:strand:- start:395 stop:1453 length:1059 start_codon:yes stop_codon:yes gene_type:complete